MAADIYFNSLQILQHIFVPKNTMFGFYSVDYGMSAKLFWICLMVECIRTITPDPTDSILAEPTNDLLNTNKQMIY